MLKEELIFRFDLQLFADDADKTEEATPRRKQEARKKGQVPKSTELNSIVLLLIAFVLLNFFGAWFYQEFVAFFKNSLSITSFATLNEASLNQLVWQNAMFFGKVFFPLGVGVMLAGIVINFLQVGPLFTLEPLKPKFNRLNPLNGLKRFFSSQGLVDLVKSSSKLAVVMYLAYLTIQEKLVVFLDMIRQTPLEVAIVIWETIFSIALKACLFLFVLAIFDYFYQRWQHKKNLRMSKHDVKQEYKQTEGNPLIKSKIRQRQRQMANQRMMQEVPSADVVITNPTHLAIAIKYQPGMSAPLVVAKGAGLVAEKIKEVAREHQITLVENKPLARAIFKTVDIGKAIPEELYQAVAEVLAFVYRLKQRKK